MAAAVAVVIVVAAPAFFGRHPQGDLSFAPRGEARGAALDARHLGFDVRVHHGSAGGEGVVLVEGNTVHLGDGFSFTLHNLSEQAPYFMLLAVDARGEVHWFYPSFPTAAANPVSSQLPLHQRVVPLPEGVVPESPALGAFQLVALFSAHPLKAREVEASLKAHGGVVSAALPDVTSQRLQLQLQP